MYYREHLTYKGITMFYFLLETQKRLFYPYAQYLQSYLKMNTLYENMFHANPISNYFQAKNELQLEFLKDYKKPQFGFTTLEKDGKVYEISEEIIIDDTFCQLKRFTQSPQENKKPLLIVAPLSGHYATLLRDTAKSALLDYDVYITDWKNCRDIPLSEGDFGFDDYVLYVKNYIETIKEKHAEVHVIAVCQPTVPVLCAVALLEKQNSEYIPDTVILMGGPVDTRNSPTEVNKYALNKDISWFKNNVVMPVPLYFKGAGRNVYPGFMQYTGFVAMNFKHHTQAHIDFFNNLLKGSDMNADKHRKFYEEYNAVMDLPGKYYLETLERIFIDQHLAKDTMVIAGEPISLKDIVKTRLLTIEGELDDISGTGQTHATQTLCENLPLSQKKEVTIENVGHYGIFAGRKWREIIYPLVSDYIKNK